MNLFLDTEFNGFNGELRTLHERCDDYYRKLNTLLKSWRLHAPDEEYLLIRDLQARVKELEESNASLQKPISCRRRRPHD